MVLAAVFMIHFPLAVLLIASERNSPERSLAEAVEVQEQLNTLRKELKRRTDSYRMVVSAVQTFNDELCHIGSPTDDPLCKIATYENGLRPIIQHFIQSIGTTLGVTSHQFSLEVYLLPNVEVKLEHADPCHLCDKMILQFYYSPRGDRCDQSNFGYNSPAHLGMAKLIASEQHIDTDKPLFYTDGKVNPNVYFRRYATAPIKWPCSEDMPMGLIVLTSSQDEPFAEDALDTLKLMGSLISNFTNQYAMCIYQHRRA